MRDLLDILAAAERSAAAGEVATLATVVRVEGSSYRLPGARMLVDAAGRRTGSVSGGCLESDVARRGRLLSADRPTTVVRYDASDDGSGEDAAWGFALGCNGSIDVLIERLSPTSDALRFVQRCVRDRCRGAVMHVFQVDGDLDVSPGVRLAVLGDGTVAHDPAGLAARFDAVGADAIDCVRSGESGTVVYETAGGRLHVLAEAVVPPVPVVIFGGGPDAVPLVAAAKGLGWHVTVCDRQSGHARADRFPLADAVVVAGADAVAAGRVPLSADTVAVVMTHHYPEDRALLGALLRSPARYVGILGPRARTDRALADWLASGERFTPEQLVRLHAPVGLDLGGDGSEAVALSVVAEILATLSRRPGGPLRDRAGPIHPPARVRHAVLG
jgi:xanthine/CO dehydrogenase XdhC/CoxF family maturation factor